MFLSRNWGWVFEVLATWGYALGGDDLDQVIIEWLVDEFKDQVLI